LKRSALAGKPPVAPGSRGTRGQDDSIVYHSNPLGTYVGDEFPSPKVICSIFKTFSQAIAQEYTQSLRDNIQTFFMAKDVL
jgi:hypothetical protein